MLKFLLIFIVNVFRNFSTRHPCKMPAILRDIADGASSHTARNTLTYLQHENVTFIEPDMLPPNSPDLNPVDYAVWGALQQIIYQRQRFTSTTIKLGLAEARCYDTKIC